MARNLKHLAHEKVMLNKNLGGAAILDLSIRTSAVLAACC